jgi:hypothetical protein
MIGMITMIHLLSGMVNINRISTVSKKIIHNKTIISKHRTLQHRIIKIIKINDLLLLIL